MSNVVNALPTKRFFIENITRDLTLEDAILDLVDNSIDAFLRVHDLDLSSKLLTEPETVVGSLSKTDRAHVEIKISDDEISVLDRSGGIEFDDAVRHVFRFGRSEDQESTLGVYGIGLKRAVFKMGRDIYVESATKQSGFVVHIPVVEWARNDEDWTIPIIRQDPASPSQAGTTIVVRELTPEVRLRIKDGTLFKRLKDTIARTYTLFLEHFADISLNDSPIHPRRLPIAASKDLAPAFLEIERNGVDVEIIAGLAERVDHEWGAESAGWYVLCNGRVVVEADKTDLTGWGLRSPQFVSKYRGFIGVAFFFSDEPARLPWTTTKRGLNQESEVFQVARNEMAAVARPVISFLNSMYPSERGELVIERELADNLRPVALSAVASAGETRFKPPAVSRGTKRTTVSVQFSARLADVDRIRKCINKPNWGAGAIGKHAFDYFLRMECPE